MVLSRYLLSRSLVLLVMLFETSIVCADLTVIHDNGKARPISEFLSPLKTRGVPDTEVVLDHKRLDAADPLALLPIRSPGLTPGTIRPRSHPLPFAQPFFMIGSDAWSQRWLQNNRAWLIAHGAIGLLVEAQNVEDLEVIAALADGLPITPASGSDIGTQLGIQHYPVAIANGRIWQ